MRVEQVIFLTGERLPMLLDDDGLPAAAACEWVLSRRQRAFATLSRNMRGMANPRWEKSRRIDIYERIRSGRQFTAAELTSLVEHLRRPQLTDQTVRGGQSDTANKRISTTRRHLTARSAAKRPALLPDVTAQPM